MVKKPNLILDIRGVIATNFSPNFWQGLSSEFVVPYDSLNQFKKGIREELWTGRISEEKFWLRLKQVFPAIAIDKAKSILLIPSDNCNRLKKSLWSEFADIHLLSNHRSEWMKLLTPIQPYIKTVILSCETGFSKPQADIFLWRCTIFLTVRFCSLTTK
jgi:putative hydrolase of the HAD superfamily